MLQGWQHKVVTILLYHDCIGLVGTACSKLVDNLGQAVRTQLVDGLLADLLQDVIFACVVLIRFIKLSACPRV